MRTGARFRTRRPVARKFLEGEGRIGRVSASAGNACKRRKHNPYKPFQVGLHRLVQINRVFKAPVKHRSWSAAKFDSTRARSFRLYKIRANEKAVEALPR